MITFYEIYFNFQTMFSWLHHSHISVWKKFWLVRLYTSYTKEVPVISIWLYTGTMLWAKYMHSCLVFSFQRNFDNTFYDRNCTNHISKCCCRLGELYLSPSGFEGKQWQWATRTTSHKCEIITFQTSQYKIAL